MRARDDEVRSSLPPAMLLLIFHYFLIIHAHSLLLIDAHAPLVLTIMLMPPFAMLDCHHFAIP